jgi:hypothetical protein
MAFAATGQHILTTWWYSSRNKWKIKNYLSSTYVSTRPMAIYNATLNSRILANLSLIQSTTWKKGIMFVLLKVARSATPKNVIWSDTWKATIIRFELPRIQASKKSYKRRPMIPIMNNSGITIFPNKSKS